MSDHDLQTGKQRRICVYPLPNQAAAESLQTTAAVVIDVLRASTVITYAAQSGIREVIPVVKIPAAFRLKKNYPAEDALLGGERLGLPIDGFDLGNSPQHYTPEKVAGKTLILTTTNGTAAIEAAQSAKSIVIASFLNAKAVAEHLQHETDIAFLCAGTNGSETEEDLLLAGCLITRLRVRQSDRLNNDAIRAAGLWREPQNAAELAHRLRESTGGKNLLRLGLDADITAAAQIDSIDLVPQRGKLLRGRRKEEGVRKMEEEEEEQSLHTQAQG